ncbi:hypothetical protein MMPV_000434 [Pyropia vietnamensis]
MAAFVGPAAALACRRPCRLRVSTFPGSPPPTGTASSAPSPQRAAAARRGHRPSVWSCPPPSPARQVVVVTAAAGSPPPVAFPAAPDRALHVLLLGSGGREHALAAAVAASPRLASLTVAPGNIGMTTLPRTTIRPSFRGAEDPAAVVALATEVAADLVIVGPEAPLVVGVVDALEAAGVPAFGPSAGAAALEGSKAYMKDFLARHAVPSAWYGTFTDAEKAKEFLRERVATDGGGRCVVKADGLAAGKGVLLCHSLANAEAAVDAMLTGGAFGAAGSTVVIEEFLDGEELSFFAIVDGDAVLPLASAQDHKAAGEGDTGPNTGGMGAYSPAPVCSSALAAKIMEEVVGPTVRGMVAEGVPFTGVLYTGLMVAPNGSVKVLEFNVRFGDPECQVLVARLASDLLPLLSAAARHRLADEYEVWGGGGGGGGGAITDVASAPTKARLEWHPHAAVVVVLASVGYPGAYEAAIGSVISGLDAADALDGVTVYHAGTAPLEGAVDAPPPADGDAAAGGVVPAVAAAGGRVLGVTAVGPTIAAAKARAYEGVDAVVWSQGWCRRDIAWRGVEREAAEPLVLGGSE